MNFFKEEKHPTDGHFKVVSSITHVKDQTTCSVQPDLDLDCPHKQADLVPAL